MQTVSIRELKNKLSEYLRRVRLGERVLVTDCGEVVAQFLPPGQGQGQVYSNVSPGLQALAKRRLVTLGAGSGADLYPALLRQAGRQRSAELLDEERGPP